MTTLWFGQVDAKKRRLTETTIQMVLDFHSKLNDRLSNQKPIIKAEKLPSSFTGVPSSDEEDDDSALKWARKHKYNLGQQVWSLNPFYSVCFFHKKGSKECKKPNWFSNQTWLPERGEDPGTAWAGAESSWGSCEGAPSRPGFCFAKLFQWQVNEPKGGWYQIPLESPIPRQERRQGVVLSGEEKTARDWEARKRKKRKRKF